MTTTTNVFDEKNYGAESAMSSLTVDWGKIGDYILGTFVRVRHNVKTKHGENSIYEIFAERGQFNRLDNKVLTGEVVNIGKDEIWGVWGRKNDIFNGQMNSLRPGQVVKLIYAEDKKTDIGTAKIVKIYAPKDNEGKVMMNQEWLDNQSVTGIDM